VFISRLATVVRNLARRSHIDRQVDEELRAFVEMLADEHVAGGMSEAEARRLALIELGGVDQVKERVRDVKAGATIDQLRQDVVYAARMLRRSPGFTAVAIATLALGVGANAAVFSIVDTVVFRQLPYRDPDHLIKICARSQSNDSCGDDFSAEELFALRAQTDVFEGIAADDGYGANVVRPDGSKESVGVATVSANWLDTLGVRPILGRDFASDEGEPGRDTVVVLTNDYWQRRFNGDQQIVGATLNIDGVAHTVIGILPPNVLRAHSGVLKPLVLAGNSTRSLDLFGRLRPGVTLPQARASVEAIGKRFELESPATNAGRAFAVRPLGKYYALVPSKARDGLILMLGAVAVVLLIACANVANLLLARASSRRKEAVVRAALGASRGRLVRQFLIEHTLLFLLGGALGLVVAHVTLDAIIGLALAGGYIPPQMTVATDLRVVGVSLCISLLTGIVFGVAPALQASRVNLNVDLRSSAQTLTADSHRGRARRVLIVAELALSLVLLAGFGLLIRSFERVYSASAGFDPENLVISGSDGGRSFPEAVAFWQAVLDRARTIPGVTSAAISSRPPVHGARVQSFGIQGDVRQAQSGSGSLSQALRAGDIFVSNDYFETTRIPLLKGRAFTPADTGASTPVAIVSQSLARRYFGDADPIGRRISLIEKSPMICCATPGLVDGVWREIVGVVGDVRQANLDDEPAVTIYRPYQQIVEHDMFLLVRARSAAESRRVVGELRSLMIGVHPESEWWDVRLMVDTIRASESIRLRRFVLILLGSFAAIAIALAAVGVYGVAANAVAVRTKEIGVRIALGASQPAVLRQIVGEMLTLTACGVAVGAAGTLALVRLIQSMLFGVSPMDAATYIVVAVFLGAVVLLATLIPARRAMQIDPVAALRAE
jgi:predicted permease